MAAKSRMSAIWSLLSEQRTCARHAANDVIDPKRSFAWQCRCRQGSTLRDGTRRRSLSHAAVPPQAPADPVGQLKIPLRPLQRLDRRLLVNRQHQRAVERKPNNFSCLGREGGVVALAPGFTGRKVDLVGAQEAQDVQTGDRGAEPKYTVPAQTGRS